MKFKILAMAALSVTAFSANAADVVETVPVPVEFVIPAPETSWYLGGIAGLGLSNGNPTEIGIVGGYDVNEYLSIEGRYEHSLKGAVDDRISGNIVVGKDVGVFKPYVHAGVGYEWGSVDRTIFSTGVGTKVHFSPSVDLDIRYRYIDGFHHKNETHTISTGIEFRF